jgi:hypothetical protein
MVVSEVDLDYIFDLSYESCLKHLHFIKDFFIVSPNPIKVKSIIHKYNISSINLKVYHDHDFLTVDERQYCGWSKQQILKLKSDVICNTDLIITVGADTILRSKIELADLYKHEYNKVLYRKHLSKNNHYSFEFKRVENILSILQALSFSENEVDFIFDLFCFQKDILKKLREHLTNLYGNDFFCKIFPKDVNTIEEMTQIGEWTLYSIFVIEFINEEYKLIDASSIVKQVHSESDFGKLLKDKFYFNAIHFVKKSFYRNEIIKFLSKNENTSSKRLN